MYTKEKKHALLKILKSQEILIHGQIDKLLNASQVLEANGNSATLSAKQAINEVLGGLRYERGLISEFKNELSE